MKKLTLAVVAIIGTSMTRVSAQVPNMGFEKWDSLTFINGVRIYDPEEWASSNIEMFSFNGTQTVEPTRDAHSGKYAVKLTSMLDDQGLPGTYLTTGHSLNNDLADPMTEKFPLNGRINGFEGYYKYMPNGIDSFRIYLALYRDGQYVGQAFMESGTAASTYTRFAWPINFPANIPAPDSAKFVIQPSIFDGGQGSILYLDDLKLSYGFATGLASLEEVPSIKIYPNPTTHQLNFLGYNPRHRYKYQIQNLNGQQIATGNLETDNLSVSSLETGLYLLTLINEEGLISKHKFMKQ